MRICRVALLLTLIAAVFTTAAAAERWVPQRCLDLVADPAGDDWNDTYSRGFRAIEREAFEDAEQEMCRALMAARSFEPRDWRFAETLDELGLVAFSLRDFSLAEQLQGAAIAEMLLAVGPRGEPLADEGVSKQSPIRTECRSGIRSYTKRLGWILRETAGRLDVESLEHEPWRVFAAGYLPLDENLSERLEWLISRYLLEENLVAAETLRELQRDIDRR